MTILGYTQLAAEVISLITSVVFIKRLQANKWLLWIPFLLYTCIVEIWGAYISEVYNGNNLWLYNPYIIVCNAFYSCFLIQVSILEKKTKRKRYRYIIVVSAGCLFWYLKWGVRTDIVGYFLNLGAFAICLLSMLFFFTQIRHAYLHQSLEKIPGFWIASGLLIFYSGISLCMSVYNFLAAAKIRVWDEKIQNLIAQTLSLLLYAAITLAFVYANTHQRHHQLFD
jgi:hypothetical protein